MIVLDSLRVILRQHVLPAAAVAYVCAMSLWCLPDGIPFKAAMVNTIRPAVIWSGLWQGWEMFAPNPRVEDIYVSARIYWKDGAPETVILSDMSKMGYWERYAKERRRKFFNDNLRLDSSYQLWPAFASYLAKTLSSERGSRVLMIQLVRSWRNVTTPEWSDWQHHAWYTWPHSTSRGYP